MSNCAHYRMPKKSWQVLVALYAASNDNHDRVLTSGVRPFFVIATNGEDQGLSLSTWLRRLVSVGLATAKRKVNSQKAPIYYRLTDEGVSACHLFESHMKLDNLAALYSYNVLMPFQDAPPHGPAKTAQTKKAKAPPITADTAFSDETESGEVVRKTYCEWVSTLPPYIPAHRRPAAAHLYARYAA